MISSVQSLAALAVIAKKAWPCTHQARAVAAFPLQSGLDPKRTNFQQNPVHNDGAEIPSRVSLERK
jgi:hypothetical protein